MLLEQFYLACLSQASYLVADAQSRRAVVVDPRRDIEEYLRYAADHELTIELVLLTHVHADFVPGFSELAARTGATVAIGAEAPVDFPVRRLVDGEWLHLGDPRTGTALRVIATPGHTPESVTYAVFEHGQDSAPSAILTGDTLFIGDVGRPDLLGAVGQTPEDMARQLYRSLHTRLLDLPDGVLVYPGHGAGSACGKALSTETVSTMGEQRSSNYALAPMDVEDFVRVVTEGLGEPPSYFAAEVALNRAGHEPLDTTFEPPSFAPAEAVARGENGWLLLDVRDEQEFAAGHLRGSINVGLSGRFAEYAAAIAEPGQAIVVVGDPEQAREARLRLARVGLDSVAGAVTDLGGLAAESHLTAPASRVTAVGAAALLASGAGLQVIDVRGPGEHADGALPGAVNLPLPRLRSLLDQIDRDLPVLVHCAGGYRSSVAASLLRARGYDDVTDLIGGYTAWTERATAGR